MHVNGRACLRNRLRTNDGLEGRLHHVRVAAVDVLEVARGEVDARRLALLDELADLSGSGSVSGWDVHLM